MNSILTAVVAALCGVFFGWAYRALRPQKGQLPIDESIDAAAEKKAAEAEERVEKTDGNTLVSSSPDRDAHRERMGKITAGFRERIRNRFREKLPGNGGNGPDRDR